MSVLFLSAADAAEQTGHLLFLFIYGFIPSFQVAFNSKEKKIKSFFGTLILHHTRGISWGIGLIIGLKNIILNKK